jgi:Zn ribbon nucleic-acid-binding protein
VYTLYCPSCGHHQREAFVRVGALVACPNCGHHYRVDPAHVQRHAAPKLQLDTGQSDPLLPAGHPSPRDPASADAASQQATGLTGLSGLMEREQQTPHPNPTQPAQPVGEATGGAGSGLGRMIPEGTSRRNELKAMNARQRWLLFGLLLALALVLGLLAALLLA